jgi:quercetin dioxygenase-like cupin family protein
MSKYFPEPGEMGRHEIFPGVRIRTAACERMQMSLVELDPGAVVSEHSHPNEQVGLMISGRAVFTIGGERKTLGPGDTYVIPGGVAHHVAALDEPVRVIDIFTPVRDEYR